MSTDPDKRFDQTVPVMLRPGRIHMVGSAREAAETLLFRWPVEKPGKRHLAAREACLKVLQGVAETRRARRAFEAAAREAGILAEGVKR